MNFSKHSRYFFICSFIIVSIWHCTHNWIELERMKSYGYGCSLIWKTTLTPSLLVGAAHKWMTPNPVNGINLIIVLCKVSTTTNSVVLQWCCCLNAVNKHDRFHAIYKPHNPNISVVLNNYAIRIEQPTHPNNTGL